MQPEILLVGSSWTTIDENTDLQLDEQVFEATHAALKNAGLSRHQVGMSVISSLDLYDGRSISNALTAPAAAGYLNEEFRVEGDAAGALLAALAALAAGEVECAVVVGMHVPEIASTGESAIRALREQVSSYTFDAHLDRPVGMTSEVTLGLLTDARLSDGAITRRDLAERAARDISRGATGRGIRAAADAESVLAAPTAVGTLTELMLPAASAGVGVLVLASGVLGRRCPRPVARITGWGMSTGVASHDPAWLREPEAATARAAKQAFGRAGIAEPAERVQAVELTDLTPALTGPLLTALGLDGIDDAHVNASGGVRGNFPGIANGVLRVIEAGTAVSSSPEVSCAVAHAVDDVCGLVSSTASVIVMEEV
jgi:hypothetical protein